MSILRNEGRFRRYSVHRGVSADVPRGSEFIGIDYDAGKQSHFLIVAHSSFDKVSNIDDIPWGEASSQTKPPVDHLYLGKALEKDFWLPLYERYSIQDAYKILVELVRANEGKEPQQIHARL